MSKLFKIVAIVLVLFTIYAPSCVDEQYIAMREEAKLNKERNEVLAEFKSDHLSEASLMAFEKNAVQKLTDLHDYLKILADTSLNHTFREKAGALVLNTFITEKVFISLQPVENDGPQKYVAGRLIQLINSNKLILQHFTFDSIVVNDPLRKSDGETFTGKLSFIQRFSESSLGGQNNYKAYREADFYLLKENKIFDADTLRTWNVRLGDIR